MRILRVIPSINPSGGGPMEGARRIDEKLRHLGHHIEVVTLDPPSSADFLSNYPASAVHTLGPCFSKYRFSVNLVRWLARNARRFDAGIINGLWQFHSVAGANAFKKANVPYVVFTHGMLDPWFKKRYPAKHLKKWMFWPWGDYRVLRDAHKVLFTSAEEKRLAKETFWLYKCNAAVISYGAAPPPENEVELASKFLSKYPELKGKRTFLFLSRIHEKKGCDMLIEAFASVAKENEDLHLILAGPDHSELKPRLEDIAKIHGILHRITWPGMLQGDDKWGAFFSAEVFCLPSHQENFGIAVAESLACGRPVIISDKVNIWREIADMGAGIVEPDTVQGTTSALERYLTLTPQQLSEMKAAARPAYERKFSVTSAAKELSDILTHLNNK